MRLPHSADMNSALITKIAFAKLRGVSPSTITYWIARGRIHGAALAGAGHSARIVVAAANEQLAAAEQQPKVLSRSIRDRAPPNADAMSMTKIEFATLMRVSGGRVSQWIKAGRIYGDALIGKGRAARIRPALARAQLAAGKGKTPAARASAEQFVLF